MSYNFGKAEVCAWIRENFTPGDSILDVGAKDGTWKYLLQEYGRMDAVEIFEPNCRTIKGLYRNVFNTDIAKFQYDWYDLVIFGDVIEHMDVQTAQNVLRYASGHCRDMVVAVPYLYEQGAIYGNPYEIHLQPDLTAEIFAQRYPDLDVLVNTNFNYCYYHRRAEK